MSSSLSSLTNTIFTAADLSSVDTPDILDSELSHVYEDGNITGIDSNMFVFLTLKVHKPSQHEHLDQTAEIMLKKTNLLPLRFNGGL